MQLFLLLFVTKIYLLVGSTDWGTRYSPGNWSGALGQLHADRVDTIGLMYQMTPTRAADFEFAIPMVQVINRIVE